MIKMKRITLFCLTVFFMFSCNQSTDDIIFMENIEFTSREKRLFSHIDFNKRADFEPIESSAVSQPPSVSLFTAGYERITAITFVFDGGRGNEILNVVVVNSRFEKITNESVEASSYSFDTNDFRRGRYRLYYVIQNNDFYVIFQGRVNFSIE